MSLQESGGVNDYVENILETVSATVTWQGRKATIYLMGRPIGTGANVEAAILDAFASNPQDVKEIEFELFLAGAYAHDADEAMDIAANFAAAEEAEEGEEEDDDDSSSGGVNWQESQEE